MLKIVSRNDVNFSCTVNEILKHELYVPGWFFETLLRAETDCIKSISVIYDEEPVAVSMVWEYPANFSIEGEQIGCFVKEEYRRQGYGTRAVRALGMEDRAWRVGTEDSGEFWINV